MPKALDLSDQVFGRLTVIARAPRRGTKTRWLCRCSCGTETITDTGSLTRSLTQSCGCFQRERVSESATVNSATHGHKRGGISTRTHSCWRNMLSRCYCKGRNDYSRYGGRGITVCDRWRLFENFLSDMGECPQGMSLDRINNDGNYEPDNCRWVSHKEQMNNMSRNRKFTLNGVTKTLQQWSEYLGVHKTTLGSRANKGWPIEKILSPSTLRNDE